MPARRSPRRPYKAVLDSPYLKKNLREVVAGAAHGAPHDLPDAGRLPEARPERDRGQRLVAPPGRLHRRHRRRPLDVDHRQQPRRPAPVPHRPPRARRGLPDDRLVGPLRARLAQRQPAAVRRPGHAAGRLLRRSGGARRPTTSAPSTTASSWPIDPKNPLPFAHAGPRRLPRGAAGRVRAAGRAERLSAVAVSRRPRAAGPDQVVRAGLPHAGRRAGGRSDFSSREPPRRRPSTAWTSRRRRPSASSAWRRAGWWSAACGSCRSSTAATAAPGPGTPTATSRPATRQLCQQVDRPIAGLLKDLKRRGLLEETLVVWATEFGRTPGAQGSDGRDHHPYGFSVWLAGGGIKGGVVHGATDELGFHAVEDRHYVTDIHATVLAPTRARPAPAGGPRPEAAGDRLRQADPPDHRLRIML